MSKSKPRDHNIVKAYHKEIDLSTKSVPSKKAYKRKPKHLPKDDQ